MYRAYHAIRGLTRSDGKSTNATYGFITMLRKLLADHQPQYIVASFDLRGQTFRSKVAADYKANRAPMPGDLAEQVPWVHEACEAMGVPILHVRRLRSGRRDRHPGHQRRRARTAGGDRDRRQGFLPARARRHPRLQPQGRRHVVRRGRREAEVRRRAVAGLRRAGVDGRFDRQRQGRAGDWREGRHRADRHLRLARGAAAARAARSSRSGIARACWPTRTRRGRAASW